MYEQLSIFQEFTECTINERKLPEGHHRIDMSVDFHTAMIVMLFSVSMIVSKIVHFIKKNIKP